MSSAIIELHYLPSISYFTALQDADEIIVEKNEHFIKQSYRNRCYINTAHGRDMLTIPLSAKSGKMVIADIRIDYSQPWRNNHWRSIISAYGKSPYFEYYADDIHAILFKGFNFLFDLNYACLSLCLSWLRWEKRISESQAYERVYGPTLMDLRNVINAKKKDGSTCYYKPVSYPQVFGNMFVPDLSLIDLVFCMGPAANKIVRLSGATH